MSVATPPDPPERATNRAPSTLPPEDDPVVEMLARALETQTAAITAGMDALGRRLDGAVSDLRAEARSTRTWFVGAILVALVVLGGIVGARTYLEVPGVGSVSSGAPDAREARDKP